MKRTKLFIAGLAAIILLLVVVQVVASNRISTAGIELGKLQAQLKDIKRQNILLREKILSLSSLPEMASRAGELGFVEGKKQIYIDTQLPLARN